MKARLVALYVLVVFIIMVGFEHFLAQAGLSQLSSLSDARQPTFKLPHQAAWNGYEAALTAANQEPAWNVDFISQLDTPISTVAVQGSYAYLGAGQQLIVLDVSNPTDLKEVGRTAIQPEWSRSEVIQGIYIAGNYAYLATWHAGFQIIDISDPTGLTKIGTYDVAGGINDMYIAGALAYLITSSNTLLVLDISDPAAVVEVGHYRMPEGQTAQAVYIANNHAYVVWQHCESIPGYPYPIPTCNGGLRVLDVSRPTTPIDTGTYEIPQRVNDIYVTRGRAYIAAGGIWIIDVSDPAAPALVGHYQRVGLVSDVYVDDSYIYAIAGGVAILKEDAPGLLHTVATYRPHREPVDIFVHENYVYVVTDGGLIAVNVFSPSTPTAINSFAPLDTAYRVHAAGSYAYVADSRQEIGGLRVVDMSVPSSPVEVGIYQVPGEVRDVYLAGDYAYLLWQRINDEGRADPFGLQVVDVSNPTAPRQVGRYDMDIDSPDTPGPGLEILVTGNYAYVAGMDGLWILDVSTPKAPVLAGVYLDQFVNYQAIDVAGDYVYIAASELSRPGELRIIDISDPAAPTEVATYGTGWGISDIYVTGDYAYLTMLEGLLILDVSDPTAPVRVSSYRFPRSGPNSAQERASEVYVAGNYAQVLWKRFDYRPWHGLRVIDVSDPAAPTEVGRIMLPEATDIHVAGPYTYVAAGGAGLITLKSKYAPIPQTTTLVPATGGILVSQPDQTTYTFPSGTFSDDVAVTHTPLVPSTVATTGALLDLGHIFEVAAVYSGTGQPARPRRSYTVTIGYTNVERGIVVENTIALYGWDGGRWVKEPTTELDAEAKRVTAALDHLGVWAVLGETQRMFLPLLAKWYDSRHPITRLTDHPASDLQPTLAADGRLAFVSNRSGPPGPEVYVRTPNDSARRVQLPNSIEEHRPLFLWDGRLTVAARYSDTGWDVIIYDDGEISFPLGQPPGDEFHPAISPDGRFLAYATEAPGNRTIHVVDLETKEALISIPTGGWGGPPDMGAGLPAWSPDSREIVFRGDDRQITDIFLLNIETGNLRQLTDDAAFDTWPSFSPDGQWILFETNRAGSDDIFAMNREGTQITPVIAWPTIEQTPAWSTDGKYILFSSNADGDSDIYRVPFVPPANSRFNRKGEDSHAPS